MIAKCYLQVDPGCLLDGSHIILEKQGADRSRFNAEFRNDLVRVSEATKPQDALTAGG